MPSLLTDKRPTKPAMVRRAPKFTMGLTPLFRFGTFGHHPDPQPSGVPLQAFNRPKGPLLEAQLACIPTHMRGDSSDCQPAGGLIS